jgi:hypothetical protein
MVAHTATYNGNVLIHSVVSCIVAGGASTCTGISIMTFTCFARPSATPLFFVFVLLTVIFVFFIIIIFVFIVLFVIVLLVLLVLLRIVFVILVIFVFFGILAPVWV